MTNKPCSQNTRSEALTRSIQILNHRLDRLHDADRRFSLLRLGVFVTGLFATGIAALVGGQTAALWAMTAGAAVFITVIFFHRRLDRWLDRFTIWHNLRQTQLARLRLDWDSIPAPAFEPPLSERCSLDIDLDLTGPRSLHRLLDLSVSQEGSRRLIVWLCNPVSDPAETTRRQAVVRELAQLPRFRDRLLLDLRLISKDPLHGERLLDWLRVPVSLPRLRRLLLIGAAFTTVNAVLFILTAAGLLPPLWIISLGLYFIFYMGTRLGELLDAVVRMDSELDKFGVLLRHLESYPLANNPNLTALCAPFRTPESLPSGQIKRVKGITAAIGLRMNPVMGFLLNAVLPWDIFFAYLAARLQERMRSVLPAWLETWYQLEALSSLAGFAWLNPGFSWPEISAANHRQPEIGILAAVGMGHPLIPGERRVCNDFAIPSLGQVYLITGSNMAGKSTFIKTVGINLCLAYAGGPVCAAALFAEPIRMHTCIRITDSIADGFSYFYAEVRCLRRLLESLHDSHPLPVLYLIDEIFRGTNNRERLIGSRSYIQTLAGAKGCGLIATHDLELAGLAQDNPAVSNFHFTDRVEDGRLAFDYQVRPGPSPTTNALRIMEMEGLPVDRS